MDAYAGIFLFKRAIEWLSENKISVLGFKALRKLEVQHPIEEVGKKSRMLMP
jgi:ketol-acid reductoisomerase